MHGPAPRARSGAFAGRLDRRRRARGRRPGGRPLRPPRKRHRHVTRAAEQPVVVQAALSSPVRHRHDVVGFPSRTSRPPGAPGHAIRSRRLRARPLAVRLDDVESTEAAGSFVAFFDLLTHVRRAAANLPLVHTGVAAERAARRAHELPAPAANRLTGGVALRLAPLFCGDDARPEGAHGLEYRRRGVRALGGGGCGGYGGHGEDLTRRNEGNGDARRGRCSRPPGARESDCDAAGWSGASSSSFAFVISVPPC